MDKLISFDLQADFGFLKKPDVNDGLQLSYNMLHKPALLGILGAIAGMKGYQEKGKFPEYYERLAGLLVGIEPLDEKHERGNFTRTVITYTNTVGYANKDGNLIIQEQTLVEPGYRCYLLLDPARNEDQKLLYERIQSGQSTYIPYLGKNEFNAWWNPEQVREYNWEPFEAQTDFRIHSLFIRELPLREQKIRAKIDYSRLSMINESSFACFERLPIYFRDDPQFIQYEWAEFAYTDWILKKETQLSNLFQLKEEETVEEKIIQLF